MKNRVKLPLKQREAAAFAALALQDELARLLERCRLSGGDCDTIRLCIGSACKCIGPQCHSEGNVVADGSTH